jgi:hypothetical protein
MVLIPDKVKDVKVHFSNLYAILVVLNL